MVDFQLLDDSSPILLVVVGAEEAEKIGIGQKPGGVGHVDRDVQLRLEKPSDRRDRRGRAPLQRNGPFVVVRRSRGLSFGVEEKLLLTDLKGLSLVVTRDLHVGITHLIRPGTHDVAQSDLRRQFHSIAGHLFAENSPEIFLRRCGVEMLGEILGDAPIERGVAHEVPHHSQKRRTFRIGDRIEDTGQLFVVRDLHVHRMREGNGVVLHHR